MTSELPERRGAENHSPETRASDAEREQVAELLREAVAEGRLDMEEFDERLGLAYQARTHGELVPLVRDLPVPGTVRAVGVAASTTAAPGEGAPGLWTGRIGKSPATSTGAIGIMGGFSRKGRWTIGRRFHATAFMGGGEIDLREAQFEESVTVIRCFAVMGGMQITAPPELDVEVRGFGFMGGFGETPDRAEIAHIGPSPDSPKVIVTGFALMGGVGVERKLRKEERRRLKEEGKREALEYRDAHRDRHRDHIDERRARAEERRDDRRERHEERRADHRDRRKEL